jgi:hypothetical protein
MTITISRDQPGNQFTFSSITEMVEVRARETPDYPIIAVPDKQFQFHEYTYADINNGADRLAHYYTSLGVKPREKGDVTSSIVTAMLAPSSIDYAINELAFAKMGKLLPLPWRYNANLVLQGTPPSSSPQTTPSPPLPIYSKPRAQQRSWSIRPSQRTARTPSPTSRRNKRVKSSTLPTRRRGIVKKPSSRTRAR